MRHSARLRNVKIAYPGMLGDTTEKGQQNPYPLVLDAPDREPEVMDLRFETGALSEDAEDPIP